MQNYSFVIDTNQTKIANEITISIIVTRKILKRQNIYCNLYLVH